MHTLLMSCQDLIQPFLLANHLYSLNGWHWFLEISGCYWLKLVVKKVVHQIVIILVASRLTQLPVVLMFAYISTR